MISLWLLEEERSRSGSVVATRVNFALILRYFQLPSNLLHGQADEQVYKTCFAEFKCHYYVPFSRMLSLSLPPPPSQTTHALSMAVLISLPTIGSLFSNLKSRADKSNGCFTAREKCDRILLEIVNEVCVFSFNEYFLRLAGQMKYFLHRVNFLVC